MSLTGIASLKGQTKTLGQFTYMDADINAEILSCISNMSLTGIASFKGHTKTLGNLSTWTLISMM